MNWVCRAFLIPSSSYVSVDVAINLFLELDWEAATATIKPANCVVNARAQVDVAPQPALHPPRDLSPALPASLGPSSHP